MKRTILPAAVLVLSVMTVSPALAQSAPSCAEAQLAFTRAQVAVDEAVSADDAAAAAKAADAALDDAEQERDDAFRALVGYPVYGVTEGDLPSAVAIRDEIRDLLALEDDTPREPRPVLEDKLELVERYIDALRAVPAAREKAEASDAVALQRAADDTDAAALTAGRDDARRAADEVCGGVTTTPPPPPFVDLDCSDFPLANDRTAQQVLDETPGADPHNLDTDGDRVACEAGEDTAPADDAQNSAPGAVVVPEGRIDTGGGPA
jgi:hypothetical protein